MHKVLSAIAANPHFYHIFQRSEGGTQLAAGGLLHQDHTTFLSELFLLQTGLYIKGEKKISPIVIPEKQDCVYGNSYVYSLKFSVSIHVAS